VCEGTVFKIGGSGKPVWMMVIKQASFQLIISGGFVCNVLLDPSVQARAFTFWAEYMKFFIRVQ
jgi:hypothetical protein